MRLARTVSKLERVECEWRRGRRSDGGRDPGHSALRHSITSFDQAERHIVVLCSRNLNVFNLQTKPLLVQASLGYTSGQDGTGESTRGQAIHTRAPTLYTTIRVITEGAAGKEGQNLSSVKNNQRFCSPAGQWWTSPVYQSAPTFVNQLVRYSLSLQYRGIRLYSRVTN